MILSTNKKVRKIIFSAISILLVVSMTMFFSMPNASTRAYATNADEKQAEVDELVARIDSIQTQINNAQKQIQESSSARAQAIEARENSQESYDFARDRIQQLKPQLQEASKNSYAASCALALLDQVVGNNIIKNICFSEPVLKVLVSHDDYMVEEIVKLYSTQETAYNEIVEHENKANEELEKSTKAQEELNTAIAEMRSQLDVANNELADIKAYEEKYGKAAANWISGHGQFAHPCPTGTTTSPFGEERTKEDGTTYCHKGIDFGASEGTPIYAAEDGTVIAATYDDDYNGGRGMWVCISHGEGLVTQYMHCSHVFVPVGAQVKKGDNIANVGNTGDSTGPHVHFQVEENGTPVDGMKYLEG